MKNIFFDLLEKWNLLNKKIYTNQVVHSALFVLLVLVVFFIILFLNIKTPMTGDDYVYSFLYQTPYRLSSFHDIIKSQQVHYEIWGGRSVVHSIAQILLFLDNCLLTDIINSVVFVIFVYVIYYMITAGKKKSISLFFIVFASIWFLQPAFAEDVLWITGSANYLWGTLIVLLFILPYRLFSNGRRANFTEVLFTILMFVGGIIAGWTNENTAAAMIIIAISFVLYNRKLKNRIPFWMYSGVLGAIIGYIFMIAAPGNFARAEGTSVNLFVIVYRILTYTQNFVNYLGAFNLLGIILLILYIRFGNEKEKRIMPYLIVFFIGMFVSIYIMVASPGFPPRAWFGSITFNIIIAGIILFNLDYGQAFFRQIKDSIFVFCVVAFCFSFYNAYNDVTAIDRIWKERLQIIEQKKQDQTNSVTFKIYYPNTKFGLGDTPYALKFISDYYEIDFKLEN